MPLTALIDYSIIIPCLNEVENLAELLPLLKKQLGDARAEIVVVDGGSTDKSKEISLNYGAKFITAPRGRAVQLNAGAHLATGKYLYFLHADTRPPQDLLAWLIHAQTNNLPAGCFRLSFDDQRPFLRLMGWFTRFDLNCFRFGDQSLLVAADHFQSTGGYDESMQLMEDNDLVVRLKKRADFEVFSAAVTTSARKYQKYGAVYLQFLYVAIYLLAQWGVGQERLVKIYGRAVRDE